MLGDLCIQNDPNSPISITPEKRKYMESRRDVEKCTAAVKKAKLKGEGEQKEICWANASLGHLRSRLEELLIVDAGTKYFAEATRLWPFGLSTSRIKPSGPRPYDALEMERVIQS